MGLIKKFADFAGTKHSIDPTGHTHSTSETWLSTIVNNLTTIINGKADSVHTHTKSQITDFAHTHAKADITDFAHTHTEFSNELGIRNELYGINNEGLNLAGGENTGGGHIWLQPNGSGELQGGIDINGRHIGGSLVQSTAPVSGESKLITSGAVYAALQTLESRIAALES